MKAIENHLFLKELNFADNFLGPEGATFIGEALKKNGTLTILNLRLNHLGRPGAQNLAPSLPYHPMLTFLDISKIRSNTFS